MNKLDLIFEDYIERMFRDPLTDKVKMIIRDAMYAGVSVGLAADEYDKPEYLNEIVKNCERDSNNDEMHKRC